MTDPRIKAGARALCVLGGGHTTEGTYPNCDHVAQHEEGARVALAAADAVDPVRQAGPWIRDADVLGLIQFTRIDEVGERDTVEPEFGIWRAFIEGMGVTVIESEP